MALQNNMLKCKHSCECWFNNALDILRHLVFKNYLWDKKHNEQVIVCYITYMSNSYLLCKWQSFYRSCHSINALNTYTGCTMSTLMAQDLWATSHYWVRVWHRCSDTLTVQCHTPSHHAWQHETDSESRKSHLPSLLSFGLTIANWHSENVLLANPLGLISPLTTTHQKSIDNSTHFHVKGISF